jgi:hypothetical protein
MAACGGGGGSGSTTSVLRFGSGNPMPDNPATGNTIPIVIDNGPVGASNIFNVPYVSVKVCQPGTSTCQLIDHVLLDTGSYGLRLLGNGALDPALTLPQQRVGGQPLAECAQFVSGYLWGGVHQADIVLGGKTALSVPVQVVGDGNPALASVPSECSNIGPSLGTVAALGARGVLGVGVLEHDCGTQCALVAIPATYYTCPGGVCASAITPLTAQVRNPVSAFAGDSNGVIVQLPPVPAGGLGSLSGTLVFGIDTQGNNGLGSATVYATDLTGNFITTYGGRTMNASFIDSGSNAFYFSDAGIAPCPVSIGFYCPPAPLTLSAVNTSPVSNVSGTVSFRIEAVPWDANPLTSVVAASIGGRILGGVVARNFDWGLPFFFGRSVYVAIEAHSTTTGGPGPYWAW